MSQKEKCQCASVSAKLMDATYQYQNTLKASFLFIKATPNWKQTYPAFNYFLKTHFKPVEENLFEIKRVCKIEIPELFLQVNEQSDFIDKLDISSDMLQQLSDLIVKCDEFKENIISILDRCEQ